MRGVYRVDTYKEEGNDMTDPFLEAFRLFSSFMSSRPKATA